MPIAAHNVNITSSCSVCSTSAEGLLSHWLLQHCTLSGRQALTPCSDENQPCQTFGGLNLCRKQPRRLFAGVERREGLPGMLFQGPPHSLQWLSLRRLQQWRCHQ